MATNKEIIEKIEQLEIETKKSKGMNMIAIALAFIAIAIPFIVELTKPPKEAIGIVFTIYFIMGVYILIKAYDLSKEFKKEKK